MIVAGGGGKVIVAAGSGGEHGDAEKENDAKANQGADGTGDVEINDVADEGIDSAKGEGQGGGDRE